MDTFDSQDTFLFILKTPLPLGDRTYSQVWGITECETIGDYVFLKIGGLSNEVLVSPQEIRYAIVCPEKPSGEHVLIANTDSEDRRDVSRDNFLFILRTPLPLGDRTYSQVWGVTEWESIGDHVLIKIGGFCNEVFVSPEELRYALVCPEKPSSEHVLLTNTDYDDLLYHPSQPLEIPRQSKR